MYVYEYFYCLINTDILTVSIPLFNGGFWQFPRPIIKFRQTSWPSFCSLMTFFPRSHGRSFPPNFPPSPSLQSLLFHLASHQLISFTKHSEVLHFVQRHDAPLVSSSAVSRPLKCLWKDLLLFLFLVLVLLLLPSYSSFSSSSFSFFFSSSSSSSLSFSSYSCPSYSSFSSFSSSLISSSFSFFLLLLLLLFHLFVQILPGKEKCEVAFVLSCIIFCFV